MKIGDLLKKPLVAAALGLVIGLLLGLLWAYEIEPVQWANVPPYQLGTTYQESYLRMAIDSFRVNPDPAVAAQRFQDLGSAGPAVLKTIEDNPGSQDPAAILNFANTVQGPSAGTTPAPTSASAGAGKTSITSYLLIIVLLIVVGVVGFAVLKYLLPILKRSRPNEPTPAMRAHDITTNTQLTDYTAMGEEPPISQFVTTYVLGDDLFDDSFSIDSPSGEFLGECGIGISETIGVGDPKKVGAFEVWLFDKNDIQTVTKVLMSSHAYNDPATFQRLEAKGEPFLVERSKQVVLETAALQLVATVSDMEYGKGAMPEESYFERLTLEIAVWPKKAQA